MNIYVPESLADDHSAPIYLIQRTGGMAGSQAYTIELEEESLDLMGGGTEPGAKALRFPLWKNMISPNRMAEHNM